MSGRTAETKRAYYQSHKEQFKNYSRKYYLKNKAKYREYCRQWRLKNKGKIAAYQAKWYYGEAGKAYLARTEEKRRKQQLRRKALSPLKYLNISREFHSSPDSKAYMVAYRNANRLKLRMGRYKWARENPHKVRAAKIVARELMNGRIFKEPCEKCGSVKDLRAAHNDYSKPLDVTWLCRVHHAERHRVVPGIIYRAKMLARSI